MSDRVERAAQRLARAEHEWKLHDNEVKVFIGFCLLIPLLLLIFEIVRALLS